MIGNTTVVYAALATFAVSSSLSAQRPASSQADSVAIAALIEQVQAANNAGDVERWVALFASDFVYMAPGAPAVTTRADLIEVARTGFRNKAAVDIEPVEIQVNGSWAFARNRVTGSVTLAESQRVVHVDVKQLVIYRKGLDGEWRIARFSSNSNG